MVKYSVMANSYAATLDANGGTRSNEGVPLGTTASGASIPVSASSVPTDPLTSPVAVMKRYIESLPPEMSARDEVRMPKFWKAVGTEFVATLLLILLGCGSCWGLKAPPENTIPVPTTESETFAMVLELKVSLAFGLSVATLVQCMGPVSGSHMNPAVSLSFLVTRHITVLRASIYAMAQCLAGLAAAGILYGLTPEAERKTTGLGATEPRSDMHVSQAFGMEFLGTLVVVLAALANADPRRSDVGFRALSIGFAYTAAHLLTFRYTGASLNPARSLGPAVVTNSWNNHWVYWLGPLLGGIIGGFTYEYTHDSSSPQSALKRSFRRKPATPSGRELMQRDHSALSSNETEMTIASNDFRV